MLLHISRFNGTHGAATTKRMSFLPGSLSTRRSFPHRPGNDDTSRIRDALGEANLHNLRPGLALPGVHPLHFLRRRGGIDVAKLVPPPVVVLQFQHRLTELSQFRLCGSFLN